MQCLHESCDITSEKSIKLLAMSQDSYKLCLCLKNLSVMVLACRTLINITNTYKGILSMVCRQIRQTHCIYVYKWYTYIVKPQGKNSLKVNDLTYPRKDGFWTTCSLLFCPYKYYSKLQTFLLPILFRGKYFISFKHFGHLQNQ